MAKLLAISVTYHMPRNRVSDTITHVTLDTINGAEERACDHFAMTCLKHCHLLRCVKTIT